MHAARRTDRAVRATAKAVALKAIRSHFGDRRQWVRIHILCIVVGGRSSEDGGQMYAKYMRGQQTRYDNRWVVPYNAYLLLRYNAHINVEYCASVKAVKYLYKYIFKGHDRAVVAMAALVSLVSFRGMTDYHIMIANAFSDMACAYSQNKMSRTARIADGDCVTIKQ